MFKTEIGARVVVRIEYPGQYAAGLPDKLNGAHGVVEAYNPRSPNGRKWLDPAIRITFDTPIESRTPGSTHASFWLPVEDVEADDDQ